MSDKTCFKCGRCLPRSEFYAHPMMGDGLLGKCKPCTRRDVQEDRARKREHYAAYDRARYRKNPERVTEAKIPEHEAARREMQCAIAKGDLVKPTTCTDCGDTPEPRNLHGHHEDYSKPLDVVWVCRICHGKRHRIDADRRAA